MLADWLPGAVTSLGTESSMSRSNSPPSAMMVETALSALVSLAVLPRPWSLVGLAHTRSIISFNEFFFCFLATPWSPLLCPWPFLYLRCPRRFVCYPTVSDCPFEVTAAKLRPILPSSASQLCAPHQSVCTLLSNRFHSADSPALLDGAVPSHSPPHPPTHPTPAPHNMSKR